MDHSPLPTLTREMKLRIFVYFSHTAPVWVGLKWAGESCSHPNLPLRRDRQWCSRVDAGTSGAWRDSWIAQQLDWWEDPQETIGVFTIGFYHEMWINMDKYGGFGFEFFASTNPMNSAELDASMLRLWGDLLGEPADWCGLGLLSGAPMEWRHLGWGMLGVYHWPKNDLNSSLVYWSVL